MTDRFVDTRVLVDFSQGADYPLVKTKFGVFNSCIVPVSHYERDLQQFAAVRPESLRIDLGWGTPWAGWTHEIFDGTPGAISYDFSEMDHLASLLNSVNVLPYWSYCYLFKPLQDPPGQFRGVPSDTVLWGQLLAAYVRHTLDSAAETRPGYHEIYNEPDNAIFFDGALDDYLELYEVGSRAIREVNADALIGGPALAFMNDWIEPFLSRVEDEHLPLDFFSFHYYGTKVPWVGPGFYSTGDFYSVLADVRDHLAKRPNLATTELHLNEFNAFPIDYPEGGSQDTYCLAAYLLRDFAYFLAQPDIALVHWAQFLDSGMDNYSGMVSIEGHRKAVFNAYEAYVGMPVDRVRLAIDGTPGLSGMASKEGHKACLILWNLGGKSSQLQVNLQNLPFTPQRLRVYRIDAEHNSWGDQPDQETLSPNEVITDFGDLRDFVWQGTLANECVLYFEMDDGANFAEGALVPTARVIRVLRYFPDRHSRAYADFDKNTWTMRLGMGGETFAHAEVGVAAENLPDRMTVEIVTEGALQQIDANSLLGIRLDYEINGRFATSVLYHGPCNGAVDLYSDQRQTSVPWGTQRSPDRIVQVERLDKFTLDVRGLAPDGWSGRHHLVAILQNAGPEVRVRVHLKPG